MKNQREQLSKDYQRIEQAIRFLNDSFHVQPSLQEIASAIGMSEYHFQRVFQRWAGISPKRFLQFLTKERAKRQLINSSVLDTSYEAGLSGPGRLHDLFVSCDAMTPGEYKQKGKGLMIYYGFHPSPFGECFIALTQRGICSLSFLDNNRKEVLRDFYKEWSNAKIEHEQKKTRVVMDKIFSSGAGIKNDPIRLLCKGSNFQIKVWEALLKIPLGKVVTYNALARSINAPKSARAVGNAIGNNSIAFLIPCHRVIRKSGALGGYRWGVVRKKAILIKEGL